MKSNPKQKAVYLALCILAAIVVWIFVDNFGNNGGAVMHTKWFRDVPITYTGETVLTERGFMLLDEDTVSTVDLEMEGTAFDLALLDKDYIRVTVDLSNVSRTGVQTVTSVIYGYTEEYFRQNITVSDRTPSVITTSWRSCTTRRWMSGARSPAMWQRVTPPESCRSAPRRSRSGAIRRMWMPSAMPR